MQIHEIHAPERKKKKTIGRGGRRGTYSGRGNKGQKARSGGNVDPLFEGGRSSLTERLKKNRGFKSRNPKKNVLSLTTLSKHFKDGETVTLESLREKKLVNKSVFGNGFKILAVGNLSKKLALGEGVEVSEKALKFFRS